MARRARALHGRDARRWAAASTFATPRIKSTPGPFREIFSPSQATCGRERAVVLCPLHVHSRSRRRSRALPQLLGPRPHEPVPRIPSALARVPRLGRAELHGRTDFSLTLLHASNTFQPIDARTGLSMPPLWRPQVVTKKEIVKHLPPILVSRSSRPKTSCKRTLDAIIALFTLVAEGRIGTPGTSASSRSRAPHGRHATRERATRSSSLPKNVVTFKPGKEMEELVRKTNPKKSSLYWTTPRMPM